MKESTDAIVVKIQIALQLQLTDYHVYKFSFKQNCIQKIITGAHLPSSGIAINKICMLESATDFIYLLIYTNYTLISSI